MFWAQVQFYFIFQSPHNSGQCSVIQQLKINVALQVQIWTTTFKALEDKFEIRPVLIAGSYILLQPLFVN